MDISQVKDLARYFFLVVLVFTAICPSVSYSEENAHEYFQKGLAHGREGLLEEALEQYQKAVALDPTHKEALFSIGFVYAQLNRIQEAKQAFTHAVDLYPNDGMSLYYLSYTDIRLGEVAEAMRNYQRAKELRFYEDPTLGNVVGTYLDDYKIREFELAYHSSSLSQNIPVKMKGNPRGDEVLIQDTIRQLEKMEYMNKRGMFTETTIEFLRWKEANTVFVEKWTVHGPQGQKSYWITFDTTPLLKDFPAKIQISITDREE